MHVQSSLTVEQEDLSLLHMWLKPFFPCSQGRVMCLGSGIAAGLRAAGTQGSQKLPCSSQATG